MIITGHAIQPPPLLSPGHHHARTASDLMVLKRDAS
jgi:hypothetical protein